MEKVNSVVVQLGMTPRYLDLYCHEALYEVDLGVNERRDRPDANEQDVEKVRQLRSRVVQRFNVR